MSKLRKGQVRYQNILSANQSGTYNESIQVYQTEKSRRQGISYVRLLKLQAKKK